MTKYEVPILEGTISSPWGPRVHPITGEESFHYGIDFAAKKGSPAMAARPGIIAEIGYNNVRGKFMIVKADDGGFDHYWHLDSVLITKTGLRVSAKQVLGLVGETGAATGPHLHFETRPALDSPNGAQIEPGPFVGNVRQVLQDLDGHLEKGSIVGNIPEPTAWPIVLVAAGMFLLLSGGLVLAGK